MAATPALAAELRARGFRNVVLWSAELTPPISSARVDLACHARSSFVSPRCGGEKTLEAFLDSLARTKVIVGDGPALDGFWQNYRMRQLRAT